MRVRKEWENVEYSFGRWTGPWSPQHRSSRAGAHFHPPGLNHSHESSRPVWQRQSFVIWFAHQPDVDADTQAAGQPGRMQAVRQSVSQLVSQDVRAWRSQGPAAADELEILGTNIAISRRHSMAGHRWLLLLSIFGDSNLKAVSPGPQIHTQMQIPVALTEWIASSRLERHQMASTRCWWAAARVNWSHICTALVIHPTDWVPQQKVRWSASLLNGVF